MSNERDTHFQNFAKLLEAELAETLEVYFDRPNATEEQIREATRLRIAQRAYDLVYSIAEHAYTSKGLPPIVGEIHQTVSMVQDLTQWPTQSQEP